MKLLLFILISYGTSNIIVYGSIFQGFRDFCKRVSPNFLGKLFTCMLCLPMWTGVLGSLLVFSPTGYYELVTHNIDMSYFEIPKEWVSVFLDGCLSSGCVWVIHTFQESMEK